VRGNLEVLSGCAAVGKAVIRERRLGRPHP
jgi:hypothetical protein